MINISELIKNDHVLSSCDFKSAYVAIRRLVDLGLLCEGKCQEKK